MKPDLSDQYILITGSGRGLGRHAALHLASCGAIIGVADIDAGNAEQVAGEITSNGGKAKAYSGDMSDRKAFMAVAADFAKLGGRIDAIINNAMLLRYSPVQDVDEDTLSAMLDIGIKALFWSAQAMLAHYDKERGGCIINLASPVATRGFPNTSVYSTVKGAVTMFTKTMAAEFGPQNIRVNAVCPNEVNTPMLRTGLRERGFDPDTAIAELGKTVPLGRIAEPEDIADVVLFLASDQSRYMTGTLVEVNGGKPVS